MCKSTHAEKLTIAIVVTELIRWTVIAIPTLLSVWRYADIRGFTIFVPSANEKLQFWLITTGIFLAASLFIYLPVKLVYFKLDWTETKRLYGWRPSMLIYILMCALPCLIITSVAVKSEQYKKNVLDVETTTTLQIMVMGLTVTEWMSKLREEVLSFDLITAMSIEFFFAYDVIDFLVMGAHEAGVFTSGWFYVTYVFAFVAMFKYVPVLPVDLDEEESPKQVVICILVSMICTDFPFAVIRFTTMGLFGLRPTELVYPLKNIALIIFGSVQLYIIYKKVYRKEDPVAQIRDHRQSKHVNARLSALLEEARVRDLQQDVERGYVMDSKSASYDTTPGVPKRNSSKRSDTLTSTRLQNNKSSPQDKSTSWSEGVVVEDFEETPEMTL